MDVMTTPGSPGPIRAPERRQVSGHPRQKRVPARLLAIWDRLHPGRDRDSGTGSGKGSDIHLPAIFIGVGEPMPDW